MSASPGDLLTFETQVRQSVPPPLRPKTLVVVPRCNPEIVNELAAEQPGFAALYDQRVRQALALVRGCGLEAVAGCRTLSSRDYMDVNHLTPSGGAKLAEEIAPAIRDLARRLGYVAR